MPYPPHDGGAIGVYEIIRGVSEAGHRVTVLAVNTPKHHQPPTALDHLGPNVRMLTVDVDTRLSPWKALRNLLGLGLTYSFNALPYNVERFVSPALEAKLVGVLKSETFDVVHFDSTFVAWYAGVVRRAQAAGQLPAGPPLVLRAHNVEYVIWARLAGRERNPLKKWYLQHLAERIKGFETWMLSQVDAVAAITQEDVDRLRELGCPAPVAIVPAPANTSRFRPDPARRPQPRSLFMLGSLNWLPNLEGVEWFLREVWPQAHRELPELTLHIAGTAPPAHLTSRPEGQDNVFIHGFVESAPDFMQTYDLMLVPLLSGGGMRVKIVEGMALGKAILSTSIGAEGIDAQDGAEILLRDGAAAWLDALCDYYHGRLPLAAIGAAAAEVAQARYSTEAVAQGFVALYQQAIAARQPAPVAS
ncbi:MAG TPA: glycosyltransferase family 4 protein [Hymenobacter sp.]|nr:glycosyltransferase family 4 protein [Hymenobacter sp.]